MSEDKNKQQEHDQEMDQSNPSVDKQEVSEVELLQVQVDELKNKHLQAVADLQNYRRRMEEEKSKFGLMANKVMVDSILDVLDDVQMALNDESMDVDRAKSVLGTFTDKLSATLSMNGIQKLEVNKGDDFDASIMEAITTVPAEEPNKIVDVIASGYRYLGSDDLLKAAKVVVSK